MNPCTVQPAGLGSRKKRTSNVDVVPALVEVFAAVPDGVRNDRIWDIRRLSFAKKFGIYTHHLSPCVPAFFSCRSGRVTGTDDWGPGKVAYDSNFHAVGAVTQV